MTRSSGEGEGEAPAARSASADALADRLARVREGIAAACERAGRPVDEVSLIVVTKFHPPSLVRALASLGEHRFGESRHPESRDKAAALADIDGLEWHFVGQVQTNKARQIARYADCLHAVDRPELVDALARLERPAPLDVFVQVNLTLDTGRGGVAEAHLEPLVERVLATPVLRLRGLMAVAPLGSGGGADDAERAFARVREHGERIRCLAPAATGLSMGMSGDYASAISQGATHLRIGAAITGKRPDRP